MERAVAFIIVLVLEVRKVTFGYEQPVSWMQLPFQGKASLGRRPCIPVNSAGQLPASGSTSCQRATGSAKKEAATHQAIWADPIGVITAPTYRYQDNFVPVPASGRGVVILRARFRERKAELHFLPFRGPRRFRLGRSALTRLQVPRADDAAWGNSSP